MRVHTKVVYEWNPATDKLGLVEDEFYEYEGPVAEAKGGSQTVSNEPPAYVQGAQQNLMSLAQGLYNNANLPFTAGINPNQTMGLEQAAAAYGQLPGVFSRITDPMTGRMQYWLSPEALDIKNASPYYEGYANAITRPLYQELTEQLLPSISSGAVLTEGVGGSRQGIAEGLALGRYGQAAADTREKLATNMYGQALQAQLNAMGMAPGYGAFLGQASVLPYEGIYNIGTQQRELEQSMLSDPFNRLGWFGGFVPGQIGSTTTSPAPYTNPWAGALGGALGGGALGAMIGGASQGATFGPWGALAGGILGLLASR